MASTFISLPLAEGGVAAGVDSFNGRTGSVTSQTGDYNGALIGNSPAGGISATNVQDAIDELDSEKFPANIGEANKVLGTDSSGNVQAIPDWELNTNTGGLTTILTQDPNNGTGVSINDDQINFEPLQASPNENYNVYNTTVAFDVTSSGFSQGTAGTALQIHNANVTHSGTGDVGAINFTNNSFDIGNGTDIINVKGLAYSLGFGTFNANVNINGPLQGYGFQLNVNSAATIDTATSYVSAFYDAANIGVAPGPYTSYQAGPTIAEIENNKNYTGLNINPTIPVFSGNAGMNGVVISGILGTFDTGTFNGINISPSIDDIGSFNGISINPNIDNSLNVTGLDINMNNVVVYAGVASSLTVQDLLIEFLQPGDNDAFQIEYVDDATAGSETAGLVGQLITVHIESGVSTATQVRTAILANFVLGSNLDVTITGVGSNPQVAVGPTNFTGGENPGSVKAANFVGDVSIDGDLSFTGALSIGKLDAFAAQTIVDGGGTPTSIHSLISSPTIGANQTVANADTMGINTAALINIGDNSVITTSLLGLTALGLPAVVSMGSGSTLDVAAGATFAVSLDSSATGGTIDLLHLCNSLAIPNGTTTVNKLRGFCFALPFGPVATKTHGIFIEPDCDNWFAGSVKIGGTIDVSDTVANSSVALEVESTTKAFLNARMTSTQRDALTALNGMQIYNTTTDKLQVYAGGSWVDLH